MNDSGVLARWRSWAPQRLSILRIVTAFLLMQVGTAKLFAFPAAIMPAGGTAPLASLPGVAGILETFGGAARFLARAQSRRASRLVLLFLPLPIGRRRGAVEPGRQACKVSHLR
ncbi:MAG TPA: hypothetical protein VFU41_15970 [Gemmatimonadales bacterium]|nr:hypothetical protein [Gemmatimonadales bacterium]